VPEQHGSGDPFCDNFNAGHRRAQFLQSENPNIIAGIILELKITTSPFLKLYSPVHPEGDPRQSRAFHLIRAEVEANGPRGIAQPRLLTEDDHIAQQADAFGPLSCRFIERPNEADRAIYSFWPQYNDATAACENCDANVATPPRLTFISLDHFGSSSRTPFPIRFHRAKTRSCCRKSGEHTLVTGVPSAPLLDSSPSAGRGRSSNRPSAGWCEISP